MALPYRLRRLLAALILTATPAVASCGGDSAGPIAAATLRFVDLPGEGVVASTVTVTVEVLDGEGAPAPGIDVTLAGDGGVEISPSSVTTGSDGRATAAAVLPTTSGEVTLQASGSGLSASGTIRVVPGDPAGIEAVSGGGQEAAAGSELPDPLVVRVADVHGNGVPGETVDFDASGGASVSATGVETDAEGLASVTVTLGPVPGEQSVTASHEVGEVVFTLRAIGQAGTREEAVGVVREAVPELESESCFVIGLASQEPLPAGTRIREFASADDEPDQMVLDAESWFVFVDLHPTYRWDHPVLYVAVDVATGAVTTEAAFGPPVIDGVLRYLSLEERFGSPDRFQPEALDALPRPSCVPEVEFEQEPPGASSAGEAGIGVYRPERLGDVLRANGSGRIVGVLVNGGEPRTDKDGNPEEGESGFDADARQMKETLEGLGAEVTEFGYDSHTLLDAINGIRQAAQGLGPDDKFVLYFTGHGILNDFDGDDKPDGGRNRTLLYGAGTPNEGRWDITDSENEFGLLGLLDDIPAGTINLVVDACFSGSIPLWMGTPANGDPVEPGRPGATINVFAAASRLKPAEGLRRDDPILDPYRDHPDLEDVIPGTYAERFLNGLAGKELDSDGDGDVEVDELESAWMEQHGVLVGALEQMPPAVATFRSASLLTVDVPLIEFEHVVNGDDCPQPIGTVTLTNPSDHPVEWSASDTEGRVDTEPASGTLEPGESVEVAVEFNCSIQEDFQTELVFEGSVPGSPGFTGSASVQVSGTVTGGTE